MDRAGTDPAARQAVLTERDPAAVLRRLPDALAPRDATRAPARPGSAIRQKAAA